MKLIFATRNRHKISEISKILGPQFQLLTPADCGIEEDIPENEATILGNALAKARYVYRRTGENCFADDTGLEVAALGGDPGVFSARYAGPEHDSKANMQLLIKNMEGKADRRARFRTVIALIVKGREVTFEGEVTGTIIDTPRGADGFGYDPIFVPDGYDITFAEMGAEEKNRISHRARATQKLVDYLRSEKL